MFERNSVERGTDAGRKTFAVHLVLSDGTRLSGVCYVVATRTLDEELNHSGMYLDFAPYQGERAWIAKASIARISRIEPPKADQLERSTQFHDAADPYAILGVKRGADPSHIQTAYHSLAKKYHPDRFAGLDLPKEMAAYASDMSRRVNEAHAMLLVCEKDDAARRVHEAALAAAPKNAYEEFRQQAATRYQ